MRRSIHLFILLALNLGLTGCFSVEMRVQLQPDGQGQIIEKVAMQKAFLAEMQAMMEGLGKQMGASKKSVTEPGPMFSEKQARERAAALGPGVRFISCTPLSTAKQEGMETVYAFTDVNRLKLGSPSKALPGVSAMQSAEPMSVGTLRLEKLPGGQSRLTILPAEEMRNNTGGTEPIRDADESRPARVPTPEELKQVRALFSGMRFSVSVELQGKILTPSSPCLTGNRITLLEMDMDTLLSAAVDPSFLGALSSADPASIRKLMLEAGGIEGMVICLAPNLQIDFAR